MKTKSTGSKQSQLEYVSLEDFRAFVRNELEMKIRCLGITYVHDLLNEEITELCGQRGSHKRQKGLAHRGGSELGWVILNGQRVRIRRPRARKNGEELPLSRYRELQSMDNLADHVARMMLYGISSRNYDVVIDKFESDLGLSKSAVSREFVKKSREALNTLNSRRFPDRTFWALMIDGIEFGGSIVIVALGVDLAGNKHILGISEGSTENSDVCISLLGAIREREIKFTDKVVVVMDGAKALKKAVVSVFDKRVYIHRCLNHKRRNVESKLDKKQHREFNAKFNQAYNNNEYENAKESFDRVLKWLERVNYSAAESMREGLDELLTLHKIGMPPALRKSFYTTNLIESAFATPRERNRRVKSWRKNTDQVLRWSGAQLLTQEEKFRKVKGCKEIEEFLESFLEKPVALKKAI